MKINLTYKEANLLNAILWELAVERGTVIGNDAPWRLAPRGIDMARDIADKLEEANFKTGKDRDLSGSPKGTILDAKWSE